MWIKNLELKFQIQTSNKPPNYLKSSHLSQIGVNICGIQQKLQYLVSIEVVKPKALPQSTQ
jgi:hypothetical protein